MAQAQFHTFLDYPDTYPLPGLIVPQSVFHALGEPFQPRPPIRFSENGTGGVSLQNALSPTPTGGGGLAANTNRVGVPQLTGKTVLMACRIQWPGYPPWTENILLSADMRLIVHNVATAIKHFMDVSFPPLPLVPVFAS
ncbi:hypothetical protein PHLCEN_2v7064 [Hermanssonia centrifuga]|uniref:Uncharacterized protein n=1 Tax=Hermanssonia centrifuga TaxID=98765 RepID=A0A2R6NXN3_9APHY|nr:hypothetical protein PHLCEN_2v7064 [Hermanssonia centrifuga]